MGDQLNAQKQMQEQALVKQQEQVERAERERRKTLEYEAKLREKTEAAKALAETKGRIEQERANHDLILEKAKLEATEYRETVLKSIKDGGEMIGNGLKDFLTDREKLQNTAAAVTAIGLGLYTAKVGTGVAGRFIESRLGKPSLVRETSRVTVSMLGRQPVQSFKRIFGISNSTDTMKGLVLEESLSKQLNSVALATANTKKNRAPFRHLMLHGPPGTGKTLFAKNLAKNSGLEYAILTGGDVAPLGRDRVTEIHKLFDWANTSRRGLLLFVDEADAFLRNRDTEVISEDIRNALNAFLYRTGTETDKFMMVYASNKPSQFDGAITDRTDEIVEFKLPGMEERRGMIEMYVEKYLKGGAGGWSKEIKMEGIDEGELQKCAELTEGWSGRELAKLAIAWQSSAYGTAEATIDRKMLFEVVERHSKGKQLKESWLSEAKANAIVGES